MEASIVLSKLRNQIYELEQNGKNPAVILLSKRTYKCVSESELLYFDILNEDEVPSIYGVQVMKIPQLEGHFMKVLPSYSTEEEFDDLYPDLEREVRKNSRTQQEEEQEEK